MSSVGRGKATMEAAKRSSRKNKEAAPEDSGSYSRIQEEYNRGALNSESDSIFALDDDEVSEDEDDPVFMSDSYDESTGGDQCDRNLETEDGSVFKVGIQASGDIDAYNKYNAYAFSRGFGIRRSNKVYSGPNGKLRVRRFVCANEGLKKKNEGSTSVTKGTKLDIRTDCKAHAHFKVFENDVYVLWHFCDDHNHPPIPEGSRHQLRSHRRVLKTSASMLDGLRMAGVGPSASYKVAAQIAGGYPNVGFTKKDCMNYVTADRDKHYAAGDCQLMLDHFNLRQGQDPLFFYSIQCDSQNRMTNVFWRDGCAAQKYEHFSDVMVFDTTFKTNRYDMVCAPFVGVNNHWSNVYFGCAFMLVETIESFTWLLKTFRQSMGGVAPKTIFSDEDARIAAAIKEVFPESQHRLCIWHIGQNARQHVGRFYGVSGFREAFFALLYDIDDPDEFEEKWSKLLVEYNLAENTWLGKLYRKKALWAPAYGRDVFRGNMHSTQRSESANSVFKRLTSSTNTLTRFVEQYESHIEYLHEEERRHNYICFRGKPTITLSDVTILEHAAEAYTHTVFYRFQQQVMDSVAEVIVGGYVESDGPVFVIARGLVGKKYFVKFSQDGSTIKCSCKLFETAGYLCRHVAKVMQQHFGMEKIPPAYILTRWTMDTKFSQSLSMAHATSGGSKQGRSSVDALQRLMRMSFATMNLCSENEETIKMAEQYIDNLDRDCKTFRGDNGLVREHEVNEHVPIRTLRDPYTRNQKRRNGKARGSNGQIFRRRKKRATALDDDRTAGEPSSPAPTTTQAFMFPPYSASPPMYFGNSVNLGQPSVPNVMSFVNVPVIPSQSTDPTTMSFTQLLSQTGGNMSQRLSQSDNAVETPTRIAEDNNE